MKLSEFQLEKILILFKTSDPELFKEDSRVIARVHALELGHDKKKSSLKDFLSKVHLLDYFSNLHLQHLTSFQKILELKTKLENNNSSLINLVKDEFPKLNIDSDTLTKFINYLEEHPQIWQQFEKFALKIIASGQTKSSAKLIMERIRWEEEIENKNAEFKISNNFTAYFARCFILKYPENKGFFEFRELQGLQND